MAANYGTSDDRPLSLRAFERLPARDAYRAELVRGRVVREPPAGLEHGYRGWRIACLVGRFVEEHGLGRVFTAETGFVLSEDPPTVRAPDLAFVAAGRLPAEALPDGFGRLAPDLAVEIVSTGNTRAEIRAKVADYLDAGTRLVWVVEPRTRSITAYRPRGGVRVLRTGDVLVGEPALPGFRLAVDAVFAD